jgi:hypothetical protein
MNDTARRSKTIAHSAMGQEPRARPLDREPRVVGLHQGQRIQSAPTGRTYDRRPPAVHHRNKNACQGAVHICQGAVSTYDPLENTIDVKRTQQARPWTPQLGGERSLRVSPDSWPRQSGERRSAVDCAAASFKICEPWRRRERGDPAQIQLFQSRQRHQTRWQVR